MPENRLIEYLIYSLDENGYLSSSVEEISSSLLVEKDNVLQGLRILQSFEPNGVGARNIQECLLLQLRTLNPRQLLAEKVVEEYLTFLANKKWKQISKQLSIPVEEVQFIFDLVQTLKPRPGHAFTSESTVYIQPDLFIEWFDEELITWVNDSILPKISISKQYHDLNAITVEDDSPLKYMQEKKQQVLWLLKSVKQRQQTLLKVTKAIARKQSKFFKYGYAYLIPLTLKEIAEEIGVHESTVSRATTHKYVQTPRGLFELKYFFSSSLKADDDGSAASSLSVKEWIKKIIEDEEKRKPLSDQKIASILDQDYSIEVSRRTVAKYRDELNILPSSKRKRY